MPDIFQLTYVSTACRTPSAEDCTDILAKSRRNNSQFDITGVLLHNATHFLQTIEGPEPIVRMLYDRISKDPLHNMVNVVDERMIERRQFGGWAMAYDDGNRSPILRDQIARLLERCGPLMVAQFAFTSSRFNDTGSVAR